MSEAVALCVAGVVGVFTGMTLLSLAFRITASLVDRAARAPAGRADD